MSLFLKAFFVFIGATLWWHAPGTDWVWAVRCLAVLAGCYQVGRMDAYDDVARMLRRRP